MKPGVIVLCGLLAALGACSKKKSEQAPAAADKPAAEPAAATPGADPWSKDKGGTTDPAGGADGDDDEDGAQMPSDDGGEVTPTAGTQDDGAGGTAIERLCKRDADCGCPIADCTTFFANANLPAGVVECFVKQSCETLCAKDSGAPGSVLYKACMEGKMPTGDTGGGARKACRRDTDCPAQHDCCGGLCYQMGSSLWITACQMPSGKF